MQITSYRRHLTVGLEGQLRKQLHRQQGIRRLPEYRQERMREARRDNIEKIKRQE